MNTIHNLICSSRWWDRRVEHELLPWGLDGVELGDEVLEIGPGFGATTKLLAKRSFKLSVLELDQDYCDRLRSSLGEEVKVVQGDATKLPFEDGSFTAAVCFTMLHHIPTADLQDQAFNEIARVLRPGGTFAGTDSVGTGALFKLIHVGDTLNLINPDHLPDRLRAAGLSDSTVERSGRSMRFRARSSEPALGSRPASS
jgi:ubiquinone/menaquinone biosynthesis C-methylase UbiE